MALPVLKCPFLSQLTLQQVRASAPHIFNAGVESCPIFSQFARKITTTVVPETGNLSSMPRPLSLDEIKAIHEKVYKQQNPSAKVKAAIPTSLNTKRSSPYGDSKKKKQKCFLFVN
jgi:hypothetical protein